MAARVERIGTAESVETGRANARVKLLRAVATVLMGAGFLGPVLGILLFVIHPFVEGDRTLNRVGSGLLITSIPLLLAGSHFLDRADQVKSSCNL